MLVYCILFVCNLFIRAGNRGRWPASVKLVTLPYFNVLQVVEEPTVGRQQYCLVPNDHDYNYYYWHLLISLL